MFTKFFIAMKGLQDKIDNLLEDIDSKLSENPNLNLTKSRIVAAKESLRIATVTQKAGSFANKPPVFSTPSKKNPIPVPAVVGADDKKPSHVPTDSLTDEVFLKSAPKDIAEKYQESDIKAFATKLEIKFTDAEDLLLIINRIKKQLKADQKTNENE